MFRRCVALFSAVSAFASVANAAEPCLPFENLPEVLRGIAEHVLANVLERGAVFTLAGGVKPVSDGIYEEEVPRGRSSAQTLAQMRTLAAAFRCEGRFEAAAVLTRPDEDGDRRVALFLADTRAFRSVLRRRATLFRRLGLSSHDAIEHVLFTVENAAEPARSRALGALYGFPYEAVESFARRAAQIERTGRATRDLRWVRIDGVLGDPRFIYAVPRGSVPSAAERNLRRRCAAVRASYRRVGRALRDESGDPASPLHFVREWIRRDATIFPPLECDTALVAAVR